MIWTKNNPNYLKYLTNQAYTELAGIRTTINDGEEVAEQNELDWRNIMSYYDIIYVVYYEKRNMYVFYLIFIFSHF